MITREAIVAHMDELRAEREQLIARVNAFSGALENCEYWLAQIEEGTGEPVPSDPKGGE